MIGTRGRLSFLQYLPKKPTKWGIKLWVCAESKTVIFIILKYTLDRVTDVNMVLPTE